MTRRDVPIGAVCGVLLALFLLLGRWSPVRSVGLETSELLMPRTWVVVLLALLAHGVGASRRERRPRGARAVVLLELLVGGWLVAALSWSPDVVGAWPKAYEVILVMMAVLSTHRVVEGTRPQVFMGALWLSLLAVTGLMAAMALVSLSSASGRLAVLGGGPNVFGRNMGVLALIALARALRSGSSRLWTAATALGMLLVILSGSRGAMVATTVAAITLVALARVAPLRLLAAGGVLVGVATLVLLYTKVGQLALAYVENRLVLLLIQEQYMSGREVLYANGVRLVEQAPIMGGGLASFRLLGLGVYPHNLFLEHWCDGGLPAVLFLLAALLTAAVGAWRRGWPNPTALALAVLFFVAAQVSGDFFDTRTLFLMLPLLSVPEGVPAPRR